MNETIRNSLAMGLPGRKFKRCREISANNTVNHYRQVFEATNYHSAIDNTQDVKFLSALV